MSVDSGKPRGTFRLIEPENAVGTADFADHTDKDGIVMQLVDSLRVRSWTGRKQCHVLESTLSMVSVL